VAFNFQLNMPDALRPLADKVRRHLTATIANVSD
jgi:hypothetical protein